MSPNEFVRKIATAKRLFRNHGWRGVVSVAAKRMRYPVMRAKIKRLNPETALAYPEIVQIEASSNCNLRCPTCSLSREVNPGRHLTVEELRGILDRLPFQPASVSLNGIGEPLMNPNFMGLVDLLAERKIACSFFTNGTLLTPRLRGAILSRGNVRYVGISCDGASKAVFEQLRFGAKFETWKEYVSAFVASAHARTPHPIQTVMSTVASKGNRNGLKDIVDLAARLGFQAVQFADVMPNDPVAESLALSAADWAAVNTPELIRYGRERNVGVSANSKRAGVPPRARLRCFQPWEYMMISVEGDILPCCAIIGSDQASVMGNLFRQSFDAIWTGSQFRAFRRTSAEGNNPICSMCPYY